MENLGRLNATRQSALRLLTRREHSIFELRQKLSGRGFDQENIDQIIEEMLSQNYLNEARFVEAWVYHRQQRGFGPARIRMELQSQKINDELIQTYLDENNEDWFTKASELRYKRYGEYPEDYQNRVKQQRYLYQRGFTDAQIKAALRPN
jgi:regulatory protein